jgi:hypothetical protein
MPEVKKENTPSNERMKEISKMWKKISDNEKNEWKTKAGFYVKPTIEKPPKKLNGYQLYVKENMAFLKEKGVPSNQRMSEIGKMWKKLNETEKTGYKNLAQGKTSVLDNETHVFTDKDYQKKESPYKDDGDTSNDGETQRYKLGDDKTHEFIYEDDENTFNDGDTFENDDEKEESTILDKGKDEKEESTILDKGKDEKEESTILDKGKDEKEESTILDKGKDEKEESFPLFLSLPLSNDKNKGKDEKEESITPTKGKDKNKVKNENITEVKENENDDEKENGKDGKKKENTSSAHNKQKIISKTTQNTKK